MNPQASGRIRAAGLLGIGLAAVLLAGCTSDFLADGTGGAPVPTETSATPEPTPTEVVPTEDPNEAFDCVNLLINSPGNYVVGDCGTVTLEGTGITLTFTSIAQLVLRGDGADVLGETIGAVEISGQGADIAAFELGDLTIRGDDNVVTVETTIDTVEVQGNNNVVTAGEGILTPVGDNGLLNEIG